MADDIRLSSIASELEDEGLLGITAGAILVAFRAGSEPGLYQTTSNGFVWSKSIEFTDVFDVPIGIGRLKFPAGRIECTAGLRFDEEDGITHADLLVRMVQADASVSPLSITLDEKYVQLATAKTRPDGEIFGYDDQTFEPATFALPSIPALEISFRRGPADELLGAARFHQRAHSAAGTSAGLAAIGTGIINLSLDGKVLVFPKLGGFGLSLESLFLDLSDRNAISTASMFPEVYVPSWKGIGGQRLGFYYPISTDTDEEEWIAAELDGFLIGFDGLFSARGEIDYTSDDVDHYVRRISGGIDIRNNQPVRGELEAAISVKRVNRSLREQAENASSDALDEDQRNLINESNNAAAAASTDGDSDLGVLLCRIQLIRFQPPSEPEWIGLDITVRGYAANLTDTRPVLSFNTPQTKWIPPILLGALGIAGLIGAILNDDEDVSTSKKVTDILTFSGLILISICDLITKARAPSSRDVLPTITQFDIRKLGCRMLFQAEDDSTGLESGVYFHLLADLGIETTFDSDPMSVLEALATAGLAVVDSPFKLFNNTFTEINIEGPLKLEINNLSVGFEARGGETSFSTGIPPAGQVDLDSSAMKVTATKLPNIDLERRPGESGSGVKPLVDAYPIIKQIDGKTALGFAIGLRGAESSDFKLEIPTFGIAIYVLPKAFVTLETTLLSEPRIRFALPPTLMLDGAIEIDKPIPSFDGSQNRVSVDVGILSSSVPDENALSDDNLETLYDIGNYKYQFGGTYAWGCANESSPTTRFSFLFAAVRFDSSTPFCTIGPIGLFGLSGLFGKNIEPGSTGDTRDAMGIARWIQSTPNSFNSVTDWPSVPSPSTWHPARDIVGDRDYYVAGIRIRAGSPTDNGDTYELEVLLMAGFVDFWIAVAGNALLKSINAKLTVIFVYDRPSRSGYFKAVFQFKIDKAQEGDPNSGGKIFDVTVPLEVGGTPNATWIYLGHYANDKGGPITAKLLGGLLNPQSYIVLDTRGLTDFGLRLQNLTEPDADLDGPAFGHGTMVEFGPKRYGPSAINISLHAGIGYNFGLKCKPFLLVGDLFLGGSINLKIFFIQLGLSLYALLTGRLTSDFFEFMGELQVRVNLPWPLPDLKASVPFGFTLGDVSGVPAPLISMQTATLRRMESDAATFSHAANIDEMPVVPIDGVVALSFDKPIREILDSSGTETRLVIADTIATDSLDLIESIQTSVNDRTFNIEYTHDITDIRIACVPVSGGAEEVIEEIAATWDVPITIDDAGDMDDAQQAHHAIYFNTLTIPEMDYFNERLERTAKARETQAALPPCKTDKHVCMMTGSAPVLTANPDGSRRKLTRLTGIGDLVLTELRVLNNLSPLLIGNRSRLLWSFGKIQLPHETQVRVPIAQLVTMRLRLNTRRSLMLDGLLVRIEIPGVTGDTPTLASLHIAPASTPCNFTAVLDVLPSSTAPVEVDAQVVTCSQFGEIDVEIKIKTPELDRAIDRMTLTGPIVLFKDVAEKENNDAFSKVLSIVEASMHLLELCVDTASATPRAWEQNCLTCDENGAPATGDEAVGNFWANQLLKPDHIYTISYRIHSNGRTMAREDEPLEPEQSDAFDINSGLSADDALRTVRFRTESVPSHNIKKYLGFAYPNTGMQPVYPSRTLPLLSFKHRGLIKAIYREHHGPDSLQVRLTDIDGNEVPRQLTDTLSIQSAPSDELLEALVDACLPGAVGYSELEIDLFSRDLEVDTRYALSISDALAPEGSLPPAREVFLTSKYVDVAEHVEALDESIVQAINIPLLDLANAPNVLRDVFSEVRNNNLSGHDALIETLYRRLLGVESGRLFESLNINDTSAVQLVGRDAVTNSLVTLGIAIEMQEPILTKEGISVVHELDNALSDRGVRRINAPGQTVHLVHDRSGSRMLFLNSANLMDFAPILSPIDIGFRYSGEEALRNVVEGHEKSTFPSKPEAEQQLAIETAMDEIRSLSGVGDALMSDTASARLLPVSSL